jgi:hypothetical protein
MARSAKRQGLNGGPRLDGARQARREDILQVLSIRFVWEIKEYKAELEERLKAIDDDDRLNDLLTYTLRCPDLFYFREALLPGSGSRAAKVDPRVRREIIAEWVQRYLHMDLDLLEARLDQEKRLAAMRTRREGILEVLEGRFGDKAQAMKLDLVNFPLHEDWLDELFYLATTSPDMASVHKVVFTYLWQDQRNGISRGPAAREQSREAIIKLLGIRFGKRLGKVEAELKAIEDDDRLRALFDHAAECPDLASFRERRSPLPSQS